MKSEKVPFMLCTFSSFSCHVLLSFGGLILNFTWHPGIDLRSTNTDKDTDAPTPHFFQKLTPCVQYGLIDSRDKSYHAGTYINRVSMDREEIESEEDRADSLCREAEVAPSVALSR